ncbi:MAG: TonB-dependent receptor [Bacteroidales bacterium]|nr:TonB-dependent receptor [Bacteroidales bacterium]
MYKGTDYIQNKKENTETSGTTEKYTENREETSGWGNIIGSLRWNHTFGNSLFANTTIAYSSYNYFTENQFKSIDKVLLTNETVEKNYSAQYTSNINDLIAKIDFDYSMSNNILRFGMSNVFHTFSPGTNKYNMNDQEINEKSDTSFTNEQIRFHEPSFYIEYEMKAVEKLAINIGIRQSGYISGHNKNFNFEPRFSVNYMLTPQLAIKTGCSRMAQYMHLLNSYGVSMPTDLWVPAIKGLKPLKSDQINIGLAYNFNKKILLSMEVYQKWLTNTTDYKNGASLMTDFSPWYTKIIQGTGNSKGMEISAEKQQGRIKSSINYTLSVANRQYAEINNGKSYPFKFDRLHDLSISVNYQISKKFDVSAIWFLGTGYPVTLPVEKYMPALGLYNLSSEYGGEIDYYPSRNNYRLPVYHRLDLGFHYKKHTHIGEHNISFDIFNAYNRKNPVHMYYSGYRVKTLTYANLLPIIPSISYTLKF